jgi:hypothetical protein
VLAVQGATALPEASGLAALVSLFRRALHDPLPAAAA